MQGQIQGMKKAVQTFSRTIPPPPTHLATALIDVSGSQHCCYTCCSDRYSKRRAHVHIMKEVQKGDTFWSKVLAHQSSPVIAHTPPTYPPTHPHTHTHTHIALDLD